jgi:transcription elongation GreA/GreB family factor
MWKLETLSLYCDITHPETKINVHIVGTATNRETGELNENAPLAKVLLGLEVGDENELVVPGRPSTNYRVLKIDRPQQ